DAGAPAAPPADRLGDRERGRAHGLLGRGASRGGSGDAPLRGDGRERRPCERASDPSRSRRLERAPVAPLRGSDPGRPVRAILLRARCRGDLSLPADRQPDLRDASGAQGRAGMILAAHQPQYLPWLGYFDKMDRVDRFVLLDQVQYKKNEWQNRNRIRTATG